MESSEPPVSDPGLRNSCRLRESAWRRRVGCRARADRNQRHAATETPCDDGSAILGWMIPFLFLKKKIRARQDELQRALPDALDLMVVCVEAGLGLNQALVRVGEEMDRVSRTLAEELTLVSLEIRAGTPREEALANLGKRSGVSDIRAFTSMLIQTDRFGTSIADALRIHADELRTKRRQRAEEEAAKLTVKMLIPIVMFIFLARSLGGQVGLADRYWTRLRGLLGRPEPGDGEGLLISPSSGVHMYGMKYALDVILLDPGGRVVALYPDLAPGKRTRVHRQARFALEVPVGVIEDTNTDEGDVLEWRAPDEAEALTDRSTLILERG